MKFFNLLLASLLVMILAQSQASAGAGTVLLAKGVVNARGANDTGRVLSKGASVEEGDIITTASKSFAVIRMMDNSKLTLKPGTTIAIGKFTLEEGKEEGCINLVKGGLRTVTGLIGKRKPNSFQVDTPIASIGIRGTDFIARICANNECSSEEADSIDDNFGIDNQQEKTDVVESINSFLPEGMYGSCETGAIVMSQCAGQSAGFELGKCRISQRKDCTVVELNPGQAGYAGVPPVEVSSSNEVGQPKTAARQGDSRGARGSREPGALSRSGRNATTGGPDFGQPGDSNSVADSTSQSNAGSRSQPRPSRSGSTGAVVESQVGPVGQGSQPVVLVRPPVVLKEDPYFRMSDLDDQELDGIGQFPNTLSPTGQCTI